MANAIDAKSILLKIGGVPEFSQLVDSNVKLTTECLLSGEHGKWWAKEWDEDGIHYEAGVCVDWVSDSCSGGPGYIASLAVAQTWEGPWGFSSTDLARAEVKEDCEMSEDKCIELAYAKLCATLDV